MKSLLDTEAYQEIKTRLSNLNENSERQWGKMSVDQMAHHCQFPLKVALKKEALKPKFSPIALLFKKSMYSDKPWKKNLPTLKLAKATESYDLAAEKQTLESMVDAFHEKKSQTEWNAHPMFGKLTPEQWGKMNYKHLDHHFRQFGV